MVGDDLLAPSAGVGDFDLGTRGDPSLLVTAGPGSSFEKVRLLFKVTLTCGDVEVVFRVKVSPLLTDVGDGEVLVGSVLQDDAAVFADSLELAVVTELDDF